ncbi:hypothetical protein RhiirA4_431794 [Rhizophagus irregularis]|uniref:Uncharacterized protein n=1 Tax=Rhizophagus irregularis TaxID=588596 RepID=A0A2I1HR90_9GLOM|nr:hypothetical protein RhiirA4_431794 [Rhizophagus irregularis]
MSGDHSTTTKKEDYRIEICQDGKFAVTFDTDSSNSKDDDKDNTSPPSVGSLEKEFRWSFDISNMYKRSDDKDFKYFVLVAVSRIKVDEDMKGEVNNNNEDNYKKGNLSEKKFEYRLEDKDTPTIDIEKELDDRKKGIAISKKEFKRELENEDIKLDTTIDMEEHKSEELDDRTSELKNEPKKGIAIYRLEFEDMKMKEGMEEIKDNEKEKKKNYVLKAVTRYYYNNISGICSFVEEAPDEDEKDKDKDKKDKDKDKKNKDKDKKEKDKDKKDKDKNKKDIDNDKKDKDEDKNELKKFIILNFRGIYNFKFDDHFNFFNLDEKFEYPRSIRRELDNWYTAKTDNDCMKRLFSCIYNKYFLVTQYTNNVQSLEDFSLKVYWYIRVDKDNEESVKKKKGENDIIREDDEKIDEMEKKKMKENGNIRKWEKKIKRKFIIKKSHTVRHACKALEHLNKRYKHRNLANNYIVTHEVG